MTIPGLENEVWKAAAVNHVWQSTAVVLMAWLLTLALRNNRARVRYWVWMAASLKFLIPFSLLIGLGSHWAQPGKTAGTGSALYTAMDEIGRPYALAPTHTTMLEASIGHSSMAHWIPAMLMIVWLIGTISVLISWCGRWLHAAKIVREAAVLHDGRELEALRRVELGAGMQRPMQLLLSKNAMEPGVFGILRPILLWPAGVSEQLDDAHVEAILAHELEHVRQRDNLAAAIHMVVEALFWFHPLVWWIGAGLVEERERGCDEEVLRSCQQPSVYAESILKVCAFCLESPLACVSGVTGADLKKRIVSIMRNRPETNLGLARKLTLAAAAALVIVAPLGFGVLHAMQEPAQLLHATNAPRPSFEVATIKPNNDVRPGLFLRITHTGFDATHASLKELIRFAYAMKSYDQIVGGPNWLNSEFFDIQGKQSEADMEASKSLPMEERMNQLRLRVQSLLAERFQFNARIETRELPVYALVVAKGGPKLKEVEVSQPPQPGTPPAPGAHLPQLRKTGPNQFTATAWPMNMMTDWLSHFDEIGNRVIVDETGLIGHYDFVLNGVSQMSQLPPETQEPATSLFSALPDQLGLKLEPRRAPVEVLVIDHVERPSPN